MKTATPLLDTTDGLAPEHTYTVPGVCRNCGWSGDVRIARGCRVPSPGTLDPSARCGQCGCPSIDARVGTT